MLFLSPHIVSTRLLSSLCSLILFICFALLGPHVSKGDDPDAVDYQQLFDGRSLIGWKGDLNYWRVEDGAIVGEIPAGQSLRKNTWLVWEQGELGDFELRLQFRLSGLPAANSGIQIRCQVDSVDHVSGYQADLDMGATWLGRIYDEHGRALLVERGSRVQIAEDGERRVETFAPADQYAVLFRENAWNEYRIVAFGSHIAVYVNGTLFSELRDDQTGERDLSGKLAFQLHSGPQTRIEFKDIQLRELNAGTNPLKPLSIAPAKPKDTDKDVGSLPLDENSQPLNLDFEKGNLSDWKATGDAFRGQPVKQDGIASRWAGQVSNKQGDYFIGGFEIAKDNAVGSLESPAFEITKPYISFLIGGGDTAATRVEVISAGSPSKTLFTAVGDNREQMRRVAFDVSDYQGQKVIIRVVDESRGGWGHINFDDVRLHDKMPESVQPVGAWRSTANPLLQHLVANPSPDAKTAGAETVEQMFVPEGFSVETIAAEPKLHQPMGFTFDSKGRLWVVEGHCYPQKRPDGEGLDRILIFEDQDHDGSFESSKLFCDGLNLVSGFEVGHGGVWVGAAPELLFIPDRDGDDQPDGPPQVELDGFGFADTHETLNSFMWGPDGWLYGNQGVFNQSLIGKPGAKNDQRQLMKAGVWRYHPVRKEFEVFAHGGSNQWGLDYDQHGQIFMTHCRSYWGKGLTTHVMQGGHYWNQVNSGYANFISSAAVEQKPWMINYLLASARYGHGEGGAGRAGSKTVFGGHSHVGTMIYLGDNWPAKYQNHLFTNNLHGHQINQQVNFREAGGYNTVHAGEDVLFCEDRQYVAVDLQYGPDGAVYISDWYDPRHCHSPNVEQWDRGNGRIYRMKFDATWKPVAVNFVAATDLELVEALAHPNHWQRRMARLALSERAANKTLRKEAIAEITKLFEQAEDDRLRLQAIWALHCTGSLDAETLERAFGDSSEYVRGWAIQLACEQFEATETSFANAGKKLAERLLSIARNEDSLFVKRYLASAIQRAPNELGWNLSEQLCMDSTLNTDRDLPLLLWHGMGTFVLQDVDRAFVLAEASQVPAITDYIHWYAARNDSRGRELLVGKIQDSVGFERHNLLNILHAAVRDLRNLEVPTGWSRLAAQLYESPVQSEQNKAIAIGIAFSDSNAIAQVRRKISSAKNNVQVIKGLIPLLSSETSKENLEIYLRYLAAPELTTQIIPLLGSYDDKNVAIQLLAMYPELNDDGKVGAMEVLASRPSWAHLVLDNIRSGKLPVSSLSAFHARQMATLGDSTLTKRLESEWGKLGQSSKQLREYISKLTEEYKQAPLWAYSQSSGGAHFNRLCAQCHVTNSTSQAVAPDLRGSGAKGIEYLVENIVDPNAVIGRDYQARVLLTVEGRVITGLVEQETDSSITMRTLTDQVTVSKDDVERIQVSENSFMPEGLLDSLNDRERIELLLFLMRQ